MPRITVQVQIPRLPNYLTTLTGDVPSGMRVDVSDMSDEEIQAIGEEWTKMLKVHAAQRREAHRQARS